MWALETRCIRVEFVEVIAEAGLGGCGSLIVFVEDFLGPGDLGAFTRIAAVGTDNTFVDEVAHGFIRGVHDDHICTEVIRNAIV